MKRLENEAQANVLVEAKDRDEAGALESRKICLSCGAKQKDDGTLPCGHDNDV
ncbi:MULTISPECIES: hypothetical protein [unclassified Caballeronia]|uniref:hypothetical protein n=1 Tax=unclassified Caballeronia TaxID=2646786 RepID=UPI0028605159|nr:MULTISPECIES: hypothetical protein [unclassified Caballeronia]MDR5776605.1 hypothetical protein [Caballeronia sp. LZ002]MDR5801484.1 hypothetical protein [Caballeronia sp. LZ001]MDR5852041.1 hypothetical protein [Caballeronia sp. LZ003]